MERHEHLRGVLTMVNSEVRKRAPEHRVVAVQRADTPAERDTKERAIEDLCNIMAYGDEAEIERVVAFVYEAAWEDGYESGRQVRA